MRLVIALMLASLPVPAAGQAIVTSGAAEKLSVSLYRDPTRGTGQIDR